MTDRASGWPRFRDSPGPQEQHEDGDGVPLDNLTPWNQPHRRETRFPAQGTAAPPGRAGGGPDEWQRGVWAARPSLGWPAPSSEPCCDAGCLSSCPLSTCSGPGRGPGAGVGKQSQPDLCQSTPASLSQRRLLPTVRPAAYLPSTSRPGCHSRGTPSSGLPTLRVGWVQAFEDAAPPGPPQKVFLTLSRSGKGVSRQPVPVALVVVDSSASWKDPQAMFAVRT